jgi:nitrate reductase delta subunit
MMGSYAVLAEAFRYPAPDHLEALQVQTAALTPGSVRSGLDAFLRVISELTLSEWEELYTSTFDLNPVAPPYIGYAIWGKNNARGQFMAALNQEMRAAGIDLDGELPDHLVPVLRLLDRTMVLPTSLAPVLEPALQSICQLLVKVDPQNPYVGPLAVTLESVRYLKETC